jgi:hypothetical protein
LPTGHPPPLIFTVSGNSLSLISHLMLHTVRAASDSSMLCICTPLCCPMPALDLCVRPWMTRQFNFARSVICHNCKKHVDSTTKYLSNRLKEIKQERFAKVFGSAVAGGTAAARGTEHAYERPALSSDNLGHQMMESMGWAGGGLGSERDGITEPVRARGSGDAHARASFQY